MSFPPKEIPARGIVLPEPQEPFDPSDGEGVKDWSNDDTEPGDDDAFGPVIHRIIGNTPGDDEISEDD